MPSIVPSADRPPVLIDPPELETRVVSNVMTALAGTLVETIVRGRRSSAGTGAASGHKKLRKVHAYTIHKEGKVAKGHKGKRNQYHIIKLGGASGKRRAGEADGVALVKQVRKAVKRAMLGSSTKGMVLDPAVLRIAQVVDRALPDARQQRSEATIEKMVEALVETQDPLAGVSAQIDADNAKARVRFMETVSCLTAEQVNQGSDSKAVNKSQTGSRWKSDGKIFAVPFQRLDRYPAFQFKDGRPLPVVARILNELPDAMSPWEIAFWFVSTNGWLGGAAPWERLRDAAAVVEAARLEREAVFG